MNASIQKYPLTTRLLHWIAALIVIAIIAVGMILEDLPKGTPIRGTMFMLHISFGFVVLGLTVLRLANRLVTVVPPPEPGLPRHMILLSKAKSLVMYLLLLALPVIGWAGVSANGRPVRFFGMELPGLLAENKELGHQLMELHGAWGIILGVIVILHVAAAMYHHHVRRDNTVRRML